MGARGRAVAKAKVNRVHHAMALRPPAATVRKGVHASKVKAMVAANLDAMSNVMAAVAKNSAAIPVLTTAQRAQAVRRHVAHAQRVVAVVVKAAKVVGKTANATMAMNCHATLIL